MKDDDKGDFKGEKEKSQFNAAIAQLVRLHQIKQDIIECRRDGKIQRWVTNLLCFREELNPCMVAEEIKIADKYDKDLEDIEPCVMGRMTTSFDIKEVIGFQRFLYKIEERLGLAHQSAEDEWADDEDW
jgi:hypothetical protein